MKVSIQTLSNNDIDNIFDILASTNIYDNLLQTHSLSKATLKESLSMLLQDDSTLFFLIQLPSGAQGIMGLSQSANLYPQIFIEDPLILYVWFDNQTIIREYATLERILKDQLLTNYFNIHPRDYNEIHCFVKEGEYMVEEILSSLGEINQQTSCPPYSHYIVGIDKTHSLFDYSLSQFSVIYHIEMINENRVFIKRDDLLPFAFGGNKARKALYFFREIISGQYDTVVTYGSHRSNHCRVVASLCAKHKLKCVIISPHSKEPLNYNQHLMDWANTQIIHCAISEVKETIDHTLEKLTQLGFSPYFIAGGGHGNIGTHAYVLAYSEILAWEFEHKISFDYIFLASGTGTTQAGLFIGSQLQAEPKTKVIGFSVARAQDYGRSVIQQSVQDYLDYHQLDIPDLSLDTIEFYDHYTLSTYGQSNPTIHQTLRRLYLDHSIPTSATYTAKAYTAMEAYIRIQQLKNKNILFIHTGGIPLFFDDMHSLDSI